MKLPQTLSKVMVVDDEPLVRRLVSTILESHGYDVVVAENAADAIVLLDREPTVDLLLTDIMMPDVDGCELAEQMRMRRPALKVLFMSAHWSENSVATVGGSPMIVKPFRIDDLLGQVARTLT